MHEWMFRNIDDGSRLSDIVIPGSHDAGMWCHYSKAGTLKQPPSASVVTQDLSINHQLRAGYRMFDLRIYTGPGGALHCGHFPELFKRRGKTDPVLGGFGASLEGVLQQVQVFMSSVGTRETVILKFSHIKTGNRREVVRTVARTLDQYLYNPHRQPDTIGNIPLGRLRGKVLAVYESKFQDALRTLPLNRRKAIVCRNEKGKSGWNRITSLQKARVLILRGEYSNKRQHKDVSKKQFANAKNWWIKCQGKPECRGELMQIYWTSTFNPLGGSPLWKSNIRTNTTPLWERRGRADLEDLIGNYRPNIVITDFASENKARFILNCAYWVPRRDG